MIVVQLSELVGIQLSRVFQFKHLLVNCISKNGSKMYLLFIFLFFAQILIETWIWYISGGWILYEDNIFDILNNTLGALVLLSLPNMTSKLFLQELQSSHNDIRRSDDFLSLTLSAQDYRPLFRAYNVL